ncbi:hypothetical protein UM760_00655 [Staphylococcus aureus]|nr:hypothetical protein UM760_00655 [Staphylococcus aureus]
MKPAAIAPNPMASLPIIYRCGSASVDSNSKSPSISGKRIALIDNLRLMLGY